MTKHNTQIHTGSNTLRSASGIAVSDFSVNHNHEYNDYNKEDTGLDINSYHGIEWNNTVVHEAKKKGG